MSFFCPLVHKDTTFFYMFLQRDGIRCSRISFLSRLFLSILVRLLLRMTLIAEVEDSNKYEKGDKNESHLKGILQGVYLDLFEKIPPS